MGQELTDDVELDDIASVDGLQLALTLSNTFVIEDTFFKTDHEGEVIATFPLARIDYVKAEKRVNMMALGFLLIAGGLLAVAYLFISPNPWSWAVYGLGGFIALLGLAGLRDNLLVMGVDNDRIAFDTNEDFADVQGFAVSLSILLPY